MNFLNTRPMKVVLRYFLKVSRPLPFIEAIHFEVKKRKKYRNNEFIKYETDESSAPLHLKSIWTVTFIEAIYFEN
jgi:hypothetical protein